MSFNHLGHLLRMTSWGESHGPAIGVVVDGCPPQISLTEEDIQPYLDARRPGRSRYMTQRRENDRVEILSGVFDGQTTGSPISLIIKNTDARARDYDKLQSVYRPGHADFTYEAKYGIRDHRGGGRASARETAARVAAGAIARRVVPTISIKSWLQEVGGIRRTSDTLEPGLITPAWQEALDRARKAGDSLGGIVEIEATNVPAGLGAPIYRKLDADIASAMMSINAAKSVEIGAGLMAARLRGSQNADPIDPGPIFRKNDSGGVLGGISNGAPIVARVAFKPTPSIRQELPTIDREGRQSVVATRGRHDPCVALRVGPIMEAMMALVLADHFLMHRGQCGS